MNVYQVDGEDLIVASSLQDARRLYRDYHGESSRGRDIELLRPDYKISFQDSYNEDMQLLVSASAYEKSTPRGYYPAMR